MRPHRGAFSLVEETVPRYARQSNHLLTVMLDAVMLALHIHNAAQCRCQGLANIYNSGNNLAHENH